MNCPHCNTHIDEHAASRCLDYWIAEKVLDLSCLHDPPTGILLPVDIQVKPYSTNIAAAWQVVEKMHKLHDNTRFVVDFDAQDYMGWTVGWLQYFYDDGWCYSEYLPRAIAPTAHLAICRAAIKASA